HLPPLGIVGEHRDARGEEDPAGLPERGDGLHVLLLPHVRPACVALPRWIAEPLHQAWCPGIVTDTIARRRVPELQHDPPASGLLAVAADAPPVAVAPAGAGPELDPALRRAPPLPLVDHEAPDPVAVHPRVAVLLGPEERAPLEQVPDTGAARIAA